MKKVNLFQDDLLGSFQKRIGTSNVNFYYSQINRPLKIPKEYKRKIELIDPNNKLKQNLKNLIIFIFLSNDDCPLSFNKIRELLNKLQIFSKSTLRPNRIKLDLAELKLFDIIIIENKHEDYEDQLFILNTSLLPKYYIMNNKKLYRELKSLFLY